MKQLLKVMVSLTATWLTSLLLYLLHKYFWRPALLRRILIRRGFTVLPYRPIAGDLPELKRLEAQSQLSDMPLSPSHHHLLLPRMLPFMNNLLTDPRFSSTPGSNVVFWWGQEPTLIISNADDARSAYASDGKRLQKTPSTSARFHKLFGSGLLLANGDTWSKQRNILRPAFFSEKLKGVMAEMVTSSTQMVQKWDKELRKQGDEVELEVAQDIKTMTADILARSMFGSSYLKGKSVFQRQESLCVLLSKPKSQVLNSAIPLYEYLPTGFNLMTSRLVKENNEELLEIIKVRKKTKNPGSPTSYGTDLLGLILAAEEEESKLSDKKASLTTQEIIDECKTFFFAGSTTSADTLSWALVLLSIHEDWQQKARNEVLEVCGKNGVPKPEDLNKLKIIGMILNETLRLYAPLPWHSRREATEDIMVGDKVLPRGTMMIIPCMYLHRDKRVWGEDADEFRPERFANGVAGACKEPHAFMPFGIGPRICIGQNFAVMEAKVALSLILSHFKFRISPNYRHAPQTVITLHPKYGVQLILQPC